MRGHEQKRTQVDQIRHHHDQSTLSLSEAMFQLQQTATTRRGHSCHCEEFLSTVAGPLAHPTVGTPSLESWCERGSRRQIGKRHVPKLDPILCGRLAGECQDAWQNPMLWPYCRGFCSQTCASPTRQCTSGISEAAYARRSSAIEANRKINCDW